ncbi:MAG: NAD-dependent epimerase/dehydratase family protein [Crenarchaeota archaeon]|nr:MAG: NAD-dependent epimerase/dehydratase family protein [Thermoproteota archaeon]
MKRILITGGTGFIGRNLVQHLVNQDIVLSNFSRSKNYNLLNYESSRKFITQFAPDIIYNLASHGGSLHYVSKKAANVIHDNISMYLNLYKAAKECKKPPVIVNPISNCSYPGNTSVQKEEEWLNGPVHPSVTSFGSSKRALYHIAECYKTEHGIKSYNLIFPNAFGIYDATDPNKTHALDGMILRMMKAKKEKQKEFEIWGTGSPIREWIFSKDFAKYLVLVPNLDENIDLINIAQNKGYSIKESAEIIKKIIHFPGNLVFNTKYQDGDPVKILDDTNFKKLCSPEFTNHEVAIQETVNYYEGVL